MSEDEKKQQTDDEQDEALSSSRREFLKKSGYAAGGFIGGGLLMSLLDSPFRQKEEEDIADDAPERDYTESRMFFTRFEDFNVLEAATERIFPEDDNGPGAIGLGVPYFIDKQLAGPYGSNKYDYMQGPAQEVEGVSTYQTLMTRGEVFLEGLRKLNAESESRHGESFYDLDGEAQDELLSEMESGDIELVGVKAQTFFGLLRQMTIEGAYADPLYGGNKDMMGWKMKEHPGVRASYSDVIETEEFVDLEPMSLKDYQR
ncbi:MAG TPA: gluconate 2-dehydrogenase subunit 3 family protein [Bacillota bacterium]|nr:gluconate 2-dehydrogenase subunit 3 family protein [Bacillota bacterium]